MTSLPAFALAVVVGLGAVVAAVWSIWTGVRTRSDGGTRRPENPMGG